MPESRQQAIRLIQEGVRMLLDTLKEQEETITNQSKMLALYEMTERNDKEKIDKLRRTVRAQQASLQK